MGTESGPEGLDAYYLEGHWLSLLHTQNKHASAICKKLLSCTYARTLAPWEAGPTSKRSKLKLVLSLTLQPTYKTPL